jgi:hypothetical protein
VKENHQALSPRAGSTVKPGFACSIAANIGASPP